MNTKNPSKEALKRAAEVLGGQAAIAVLAGYKHRQAIWPYFNTERVIPAELCPAIERATTEAGSPVRCEELRPDVDWSVLRGTKA